MYKQISSVQNSAIKKLLQLQEKSRARKREGLFVIEGVRETQLALKGGYELLELFFCAELIAESTKMQFKQFPMIEISREVYQKIAYRGSTEGVIALAKTKNLGLESLCFSKGRPLIMVAESPEKPGNIGALLRTADAAGVDAVLIADPKTDLYNPNVVRSSLGGLFTNQIATGGASEIIQFLKENNIAIYAAVLQESIDYLEADFTIPSAIVVGPEAFGLGQIWRENATQNVRVPMRGQIDSMNVSVAAGVLVFEAGRQRRAIF